MIDLHCAYRKDEESPLLEELLACVHAFSRAQGTTDGAGTSRIQGSATPPEMI